MALKRKTRLSHPHERHPCSPLPRGDGAETNNDHLMTDWHFHPCSPLPRGDGAETKDIARLDWTAVACSPLPRGDGAETACGSLLAAAQELLQSPSTGRWR